MKEAVHATCRGTGACIELGWTAMKCFSGIVIGSLSFFFAGPQAYPMIFTHLAAPYILFEIEPSVCPYPESAPVSEPLQGAQGWYVNA